MFAPVSCKKFVLFLETQGFVTSFVCALQLQILAVLGPDLTLSRPRSRAAAAPCLSPGPLCCHLPAATCFNPRSGEELGLANPLILPLGYVILGGSCQRGEMEASQGRGRAEVRWVLCFGAGEMRGETLPSWTPKTCNVPRGQILQTSFPLQTRPAPRRCGASPRARQD